MVQCCFTSTETIRLIKTGIPGRPPRLSHSSWTLYRRGCWYWFYPPSPWRIGLWDLKGWRRTSWVLPGLLVALWLPTLLGFPLLLLIRLSMTPILISILLAPLEKLSLSLELLVMLLLATWQLLPGLDGTGVARSLSMCSWARERPYRRAREETGPSRRDGLCPLGCQDRLFLADSTARAWRGAWSRTRCWHKGFPGLCWVRRSCRYIAT